MAAHAGSGQLEQRAFGGFKHAVIFTPARYGERSDWPLLLYLHGASTRGDMHRLASSHGGFVRHLHSKGALSALPMVVVAPLCPSGTEWAVAEMCTRLHGLVDTAVASFKVAPTALFVTGNSMGGLGAYMLVVRDPNPRRWAGVIPICGGGHPMFASLAVDVPFWFFHAASDKVVAVEDTDKVVAALRRSGAKEVRYTRYDQAPDPDVEDYCEGHNAWDQAWTRTPELWDWVDGLATNHGSTLSSVLEPEFTAEPAVEVVAISATGDQEGAANLVDFPRDALMHIASFLNAPDVVGLGRTCRFFHMLMDHVGQRWLMQRTPQEQSWVPQNGSHSWLAARRGQTSWLHLMRAVEVLRQPPSFSRCHDLIKLSVDGKMASTGFDQQAETDWQLHWAQPYQPAVVATTSSAIMCHGRHFVNFTLDAGDDMHFGVVKHSWNPEVAEESTIGPQEDPTGSSGRRTRDDVWFFCVADGCICELQHYRATIHRLPDDN